MNSGRAPRSAVAADATPQPNRRRTPGGLPTGGECRSWGSLTRWAADSLRLRNARSRLGTVILAALFTLAPTLADQPARWFIGIPNLRGFHPAPASQPGTIQFLSPVLSPGMAWNELILSWNVDLPADATIHLEARPLLDDSPTEFLSLGRWSGTVDAARRTSVEGQQTAWGRVATDTLVLRQPARRLEVRVTLSGSPPPDPPAVRYLGLCFAQSTIAEPPRAPLRRAWGRTIRVPERTQLVYEEGARSWCSPTSTSMLLAFWAQELHRPELNQPVPTVAREVFDPGWPGTGNWPFNMAYAGSFPGLRARVARFRDLRELESWTARGLPVVLSLDYRVLQGKPEREGPDGHLVVCLGFTPDGDVVVNDPGKSDPVRRTYPRQNLVAAWARSLNTVYLVHPEARKVPPPAHGRW